jgi:DNA repair exonuclease SbcCD ATPase subunit
MNATGTMLAAPLRKREAPLASRASRRIREGQRRIKALGRELETLKTRLGECLARNTMEGKINPAEDPEVQDITWDIEKKSGTLRELQDMLKSLETTVTLLQERLAPAADKASAASPVCEEPHGSPKETAETPPTREPGTERRRVVVPEAAPAGPVEGEKPDAKAAEKVDEVVKKESGGA